MRRLAVLLALLAVGFSGCADKFLSARIAVNSGRAALNMAQVGVDTADKGIQAQCNSKLCLKVDPTQGEKYKECMTKDHSQEQAWKDCYAKFAAFKAKWPQAKRTAEAAFNTADASISLAEQMKKELAPDVIALIKATACMVGESLEFLPEKYKKQVQFYLDMMKAFGCAQKPTPDVGPAPRSTPVESSSRAVAPAPAPRREAPAAAPRR